MRTAAWRVAMVTAVAYGLPAAVLLLFAVAGVGQVGGALCLGGPFWFGAVGAVYFRRRLWGGVVYLALVLGPLGLCWLAFTGPSDGHPMAALGMLYIALGVWLLVPLQFGVAAFVSWLVDKSPARPTGLEP